MSVAKEIPMISADMSKSSIAVEEAQRHKDKPIIKKKSPKTVPKNNVNTMITQAPQSISSNDDQKSGPITQDKTSSTNLDDVICKTKKDFDSLNESSELSKPNVGIKKKRIAITKKEKKCLEEIVKITKKTRAPLDDRQMLFYNKDNNQTSKDTELAEINDISMNELSEAVSLAKENSISKVVASDVENLASFLNELKTLIASREMTWAATTENDYTQKAEISKLKSEVQHLRVVCTKRQNEIKDKDRKLLENGKELEKCQQEILRLRAAILRIEKNTIYRDEIEDRVIGDTASRVKQLSRGNTFDNAKLKSRMQLADSLFSLGHAKAERVQIQSQKPPNSPGIRRNQGPAAQIANALYRARTAGDFVNF